MFLDSVNAGSTDYSVTIRIVDATDGTPETAVVFNSPGIDLWYRRPAAAHSSITEVTQTEGGAHTDGGFVHISDGYYRLDLPDAAVAAGAEYVDIGGTVTGMVVIGGRVRLNMEANVVEWLGTAAATPTTAGVPEVDVTYFGGTIQTTGEDIANKVAAILLDTADLQTNQGNWLTATGFATPTNITAATGITVATMGANTITAASIATGAIDADAIAADAITAASIATDAIAADGLAADAVTEIQSGLATSAALATVDANVDTMVAGIITGAVNTTITPTTTTCSTNLAGYTDDQLIGRIITFTSGVCDGEQTDITDYAQTNGVLTYTLITLQPGDGDTFKIT